MPSSSIRLCLTFILTLGCGTWLPAQESGSVQQAIAKVAAVRNGGFGHEAAMEGWKVLGDTDVKSVPLILAAVQTEQPIAANWLRSAVDQILDRQMKAGKPLPLDRLEMIVFDDAYAPRARRMAYEWLRRADETAEARVIPKMLNDSSLEMRRDAVARALSEAEELGKGAEAVVRYRELLTVARDFDQVEAIEKKLADLGEEVDLQKHFGFLVSWKLIGPFDNTDKSGYDVAYEPEADLDSKAAYIGKDDKKVAWFEHTTKDKYGKVDLNDAIGKNMGAVAYAYTEFPSAQDRQVDFRLVSRNANKIWVNGELVMDNEVYHSGSKFDQYISQAKLKKGNNTVLLKICQNEQTQGWAQSWEFQVRVCDTLGTAIAPSQPER